MAPQHICPSVCPSSFLASAALPLLLHVHLAPMSTCLPGPPSVRGWLFSAHGNCCIPPQLCGRRGPGGRQGGQRGGRGGRASFSVTELPLPSARQGHRSSQHRSSVGVSSDPRPALCTGSGAPGQPIPPPHILWLLCPRSPHCGHACLRCWADQHLHPPVHLWPVLLLSNLSPSG